MKDNVHTMTKSMPYLLPFGIGIEIAWAIFTFLLGVTYNPTTSHAQSDSNSNEMPKVVQTNTSEVLMEEKLRTMIVPIVKLEQAEIDRTIIFLIEESRRLDPSRQGIKITVTEKALESASRVTAEFYSKSMYELIVCVCQRAGVKYRIENEGVTILSSNESK